MPVAVRFPNTEKLVRAAERHGRAAATRPPIVYVVYAYSRRNRHVAIVDFLRARGR